ncbi:MAG: tripartite tricarboxylate transporter substrate binding protein [Betaproteobacteria bacterium]|nr:tripartite tricarboxylate transporter substrate binding protein [Betaproteobacteria bacterium]
MSFLARLPPAVIALIVLAVPITVWTQDYPSKPVRLILPFPPGGGTDTVGRAIAQTMTAQVSFGQPVVPDNRPGAGGNLGLELAAKAAPDGYTMVLSSPLIAISPLLYAKLNYDPERDLAPVTRVGITRKVLVVHPTVPARTLKELIALARKNPGKLNVGSGGMGSANHLTSVLIQTRTGINIVHVPFKGASAALAALASGEIDMVVASIVGVVPLARAGRVRPLVVLSETRGSPLDDLPTSAEAGFPDLTDDTWYGMFAPADTPRQIVNRLNQELHKALTNPTVMKRLASVGVETQTSTPEELGRFVRSETARIAKVIKSAGIKPK